MNKTREWYDGMVRDLVKDGNVIKSELTGEQAHLWHMATGLSGEAGELLDAVKKHVIYRKPLDRINVIEELGDIMFYSTALMHIVGVTLEEVMQNNIDKLGERYKELKYSDQQAQDRADKNVK